MCVIVSQKKKKKLCVIKVCACVFSNLFLKKTKNVGTEIFRFNRKIETDTKAIFKTFKKKN